MAVGAGAASDASKRDGGKKQTVVEADELEADAALPALRALEAEEEEGAEVEASAGASRVARAPVPVAAADTA
jgi:hypothetical protein